jgi:hypothetical protein
MQGPLRFRVLAENVAWMLVYGEKDPKILADMARIKKPLDRFHPPTNGTGAQRPSGLVVLNLPTKLQGDSLLTQMSGEVEEKIVDFLDKNVARTQPKWISRRNRLP